MQAAVTAAHSLTHPAAYGGQPIAGWFSCFRILGQSAQAASDPSAICAILFDGQRDDGFVPAPFGSCPELAALPVQGLLLGELWHRHRKNTGILAPFFRKAFDCAVRQHRYLYAHRDPAQEGLLSIQYPGEDGFVNVPGYRLESGRPIEIQDPFFNTCLTWSNKALIGIGRALREDVLEIIQWHELTIHSMNEKLWDEEEGWYRAFDLNLGSHITLETLAGALPLAAEIPNQEQAERILETLNTSAWRTGSEKYGLYPSCLPAGPDASAGQGGAAWLVLNWMLYRGLALYDFSEATAVLRQKVRRCISRNGLYDAYATWPEEGAAPGLGAPGSPAAAALALHWLDK